MAARVLAADAAAYVESFPPRLTEGCRVLVLGSMPGVRSLQLQQYYGHPQNRFWPFMQALCGVSADAEYESRIAALNRAGIGVWDVLKACERPGSLDSAIARDSEVPNDIGGLLAQHPSIRALAFNGGKAWQYFRRRVLPDLAPDAVARVALCPMPSTSPLNKTKPDAERRGRWLALKEWL